jgi:ribose 5-phosphate isomerase
MFLLYRKQQYRAAKKAKISEEMTLVADKYSENDPVPCSIDDLSVTVIREKLKKIGVKTRLKNRKTKNNLTTDKSVPDMRTQKVTAESLSFTL